MMNKINYFLFESNAFLAMVASFLLAYVYHVNKIFSSVWNMIVLGWKGPVEFWLNVVFTSVVIFVVLLGFMYLVKVIYIGIIAFRNVRSGQCEHKMVQ